MKFINFSHDHQALIFVLPCLLEDQELPEYRLALDLPTNTYMHIQTLTRMCPIAQKFTFN